MSKELRICKGDVELAIYFDTKEQLVERLADYGEITKIVQEKLGVSFEEKRTARKDLEGIIDVDNGKLVLVRAPQSKVEKVCIVLYAIGSEGATPEAITAVSHVPNPSRNILNNASYKKYFRKIARGKYVLSDVGLTYVTNTILPTLRGESNNASA